jgi:ribosomal protein L37AE/L43A
MGYISVYFVSKFNSLSVKQREGRQVSVEYKNLCIKCGDHVLHQRYKLGYTTCLKCGEVVAKETKHTIAPMHKSNYMVITNREDLKGLNNKGGLVK